MGDLISVKGKVKTLTTPRSGKMPYVNETPLMGEIGIDEDGDICCYFGDEAGWEKESN
jgi:hypothetical protein